MYCPKCGDVVEQGERFCNKCGNTLDVPVNTTVEEKIDNKKMVILGLGIGGALVVVIGLIMLLSGAFNSKYYFDDNKTDGNETETPIDKSDKKVGKYQTIIIADNTYSGVKLTKDKDAIKLIEKDSVEQKDKCPKEIKKIEDQIIANYGVTAVNLCEMDIDFAKEISEVFKRIYNEYPEARGYITNLTLINGTMKNNYIAAFMPIFEFATSDTSNSYPKAYKTQVLLNTAYFLNTDRIETASAGGSNSGHFPKNATRYSSVAHELGHYLSFLTILKRYKMDSMLLLHENDFNTLYDVYTDFANGDNSLSIIKEAYEKYQKDTGDNILLDDWRGTISGYALAKDNSGNYIYDETIAESFHDVYLNGDDAAIASKYVVAVLKSRLRGA